MFCFYDVYFDKETAEFLCLNCILEQFLLRKIMFNLQVCFVLFVWRCWMIVAINISLLMLNRRWCSVNMFWCVYIHLFSFFMLHLCCKGLEMFKITCQQVSRKNWFYPLVSREMYSLIIRLDHFLYNPLPVKFVSWIDIINREWEVITFVQTFISFAFR